MQKLNNENLNTPELAYKFFKERWRSQMHYCDWNRFILMAKGFKGGKYLYAGCFNSPVPFELTRDFKDRAEIHAVDWCEPLIKELQERYPEVKYQVANVNKLPFEDGYFDWVVAGELIEHTEKPDELIKELMRVLKSGGTLALSTPLEEAVNGAVSAEHLWSFDSNDIINLLKDYGEVSIQYYKDTHNIILAFCKKK